jgi:hypothetical protein
MAQSLTQGMGAGGIVSQLKLEQGEISKSQDGKTIVRRRRRN